MIWSASVFAALAAWGPHGLPGAHGGNSAWQTVSHDSLVVTSGRIDGTDELGFRTPMIRATVGLLARTAIEMEFMYLGPTTETAPFASGEIRRQIGIKLRAHDGCNVVYVMWYVEPQAGLHVSVKSNPDLGTGDCQDRGYQNAAPTWSRANVRPVAAGEKRMLAARIVGSELQVAVDGEPAWRGRLPPQAFAFDGPVGVRSDNGQFIVTVRVSGVEK